MRRPAPSLGLVGRQAAGGTASAPTSPSQMGSCQTAEAAAGPGSPQGEASGSSGPMRVERKTRPPQRLEGGGFTIVDIMSGVPSSKLDPFLIWHELPRAFHQPGEMPGAPLHPHRGFSECPYAKEMVSKDGPSILDVFKGRDHEGNRHLMRPGDFEFGQVGQGFEHEGLVDPKWTGYLHFFQLWINLPRAHKMDPPKIINCESAKLPVALVSESPRATVKVLLGEGVFGCTSPVTSEHVPAQYLDMELAAGAQLAHQPPPHMQTRLAYVYRGEPSVCGTACSRGEFLLLGPGDVFEIEAGASDAGLLFIAGRKIGEPVVQHGPFVMNSEDDIRKCFHDYQKGRLCGRITREVIE